MRDISNLTFHQFIESAKALKDNYQCFLMPFFHAKEIRCWKTMIYSLNIPDWKHDRLWEFLNGDLEYEELVKLKDY